MNRVASVVIPTYNQRPEYLEDAIECARQQTVPVEVIVVDDGSTDAIAAYGDVRVIRHTRNMGIAHALNTGIAAMTTPWFCWVSSDDTIDHDKVRNQMARTVASESLCSFHKYSILRDGRISGESYVPMWGSLDMQRVMLSQVCNINGSTTMIHRSVFEAVGTFDTSLQYGQDWEFWNRVATRYLWHPIPVCLGMRREGGNLTERIEADPGMKRARDAENALIRERYTPS